MENQVKKQPSNALPMVPCESGRNCGNAASEDHECPYDMELSSTPFGPFKSCNCCDDCTRAINTALSVAFGRMIGGKGDDQCFLHQDCRENLKLGLACHQNKMTAGRRMDKP
jgi:hypothetical protein